MGILIKKRSWIIFDGMARLGIIALIISFASALVNTVWAIYIDSFVNSEIGVGLVSAFLTFIAFISYFAFIPLIEKYNKAKIFSYVILLSLPFYLLLGFANNFYVFLSSAFFITILFTLRNTSFGLIVKDRSRKKQLSKNEGIMYTFVNIAWIIAPLLGGFVANAYGISYVFVLSSAFLLFGFFLFRISRIKDMHAKRKLDKSIRKNFFDFFKDRDRIFAYVVGSGIIFWFVLIYLFMPVFILRNGLGTLWVGYFLFAISLPLILTEYKLSKLAGNYGFRKMFITGFFIIGIISFLCFFIGNIYLIMFLLTIASFGAAMLEPTSEAYFFNILRSGEASRFYGPYNTRIDLSGIAARLLSVVVLIFLPFRFLFILYGIFMIIMIFFTYKMRDVVENDGHLI